MIIKQNQYINYEHNHLTSLSSDWDLNSDDCFTCFLKCPKCQKKGKLILLKQNKTKPYTSEYPVFLPTGKE